MARTISMGGHRALVQMGIMRPDYVQNRWATRALPIHKKPLTRRDPRYTKTPGPMTNGPAYDCDCR